MTDIEDRNASLSVARDFLLYQIAAVKPQDVNCQTV